MKTTPNTKPAAEIAYLVTHEVGGVGFDRSLVVLTRDIDAAQAAFASVKLRGDERVRLIERSMGVDANGRINNVNTTLSLRYAR